MQNKKYLITGGAGFIGSHLCELLIEQNHNVVVVDNLSTGKISNLPNGVELIEGNVCDAKLLNSVIPKVDGVFHLAAIASVEKSTKEWYDSTQTNLMATVNVLEAIAKDGRNIPCVFASSAATYGNNPNCPLSEKEQAAPLTSYGVDKYASELHCEVGANIHAIPTAALRFFNVYGERQDPKSPYSGVISIFVGRAVAGQNITINGDGGQMRDFIYVGDICAMLYAAMQKLQAEDAQFLRFNACTGKPTTIKELAHLVKKLTNSDCEIKFGEARIGDIYKSFGNPNLIEQSLKITAKVSLEDGLERTIKWLKAS
jgi:UDP-glucose 4-epimerase